MKNKSKFYILLVSLLIICLISISTICNQCSGSTEEGVKIDIEKDSTQDSSSDSSGNDDSGVEANDNSGQDSGQSKKAPTIELKAYEGPVAAEGDVIYYRVEAIVTGNPDPDVSFSKDDSNKAWGKRKAQVNLNSGESYTLKATAKNSEGTDEASILLTPNGAQQVNLSGSSNNSPVISEIKIPAGVIVVGTVIDITAVVSDQDGDALTYQWSSAQGSFSLNASKDTQYTVPDNIGDYVITLGVIDGKGGTASKDLTIHAKEGAVGNALTLLSPVVSETGWVLSDGSGSSRSAVFVGQSLQGAEAVGFISFDISGLPGSRVVNAVLGMENPIIKEPTENIGLLTIYTVYYGPTALNKSIINEPIRGMLGSFPNGTTTIVYDEQNLTNLLNTSINNNEPRIQLKIIAQNPEMYNDGADHGLLYSNQGIYLSLEIGN